MERTGNRTGAAVKDPRKHAVILSGGGAKGAYEIGVMKALFPGYVRCASDGLEVEPVVFTGTSVGSYNAAYLVSRLEQNSKTAIGDLEGIWRNRIASTYSRPNGIMRFRANPLEGMEIDRMMADPFGPLRNFLADGAFFAKESIERAELFLKSQERLTRRAIQLIDFSAFVSTDKLHDLIRETVDLRKVRGNAERALVIAATNWEKGEVQLFGNLQAAGCPVAGIMELDDKIGHLAILASTAIPGVFPPIEVFHTKYVDGGLLLNTPLAPALKALRAVAPREKEYVIHAIYLDPDLKDVPLEQGNNTMDTLNRFTALNFASQVNRDVKQAKHVNQSLEILNAVARAGDALKKIQKRFQEFVKDEYKPLTIHRYHPRTTLGGIFGLLSFESGYVGDLIEQGFQDAVTHDCEESGCIFPTYEEVVTAKKKSREMKAAAAR